MTHSASPRTADSHGARRLPQRLSADDWQATRHLQKRVFLLRSHNLDGPLK
jgi:hypothetical protein